MSLLPIHDLPTPALVVDAHALQRNLSAMASLHPGVRLRPHVKAHKCTDLATMQHDQGHIGFTCATVREVLGMAAVGLGDDLLLANEVIDPKRLADLAHAQRHARITLAVDSELTIALAANAGIREVVIDVNVGLPRCGCAPDDAGRMADIARSHGLEVRGVMGYEGHLMAIDVVERTERVASAMHLLASAHQLVGGDIVTAGGTGTHHLHNTAVGPVNEVQAGSYLLMDSHYTAAMEHAAGAVSLTQACWVVGSVISSSATHAVADVGLKALAMDHGHPTLFGFDGSPVHGGTELRAWFYADEHVTFSPSLPVGSRVAVIPAHIDPTMAKHDQAWLSMGEQVIDQLAINLRHW